MRAVHAGGQVLAFQQSHTSVETDFRHGLGDVISAMIPPASTPESTMTVFPVADANSKFSDAAAYVFHTESAGAFGATSNPLDIICTFDAAQKIQCWAGDEYVTGDASAAAGITSTSGKLKVFVESLS